MIKFSYNEQMGRIEVEEGGFNELEWNFEIFQIDTMESTLLAEKRIKDKTLLKLFKIAFHAYHGGKKGADSRINRDDKERKG